MNIIKTGSKKKFADIIEAAKSIKDTIKAEEDDFDYLIKRDEIKDAMISFDIILQLMICIKNLYSEAKNICPDLTIEVFEEMTG